MGDNVLNSNFAAGDVVDPAHIKQIIQALLGTLFPRGPGGTILPGQDVGDPARPFGIFYGRGLVLDGQAIDFTQLTAPNNRIINAEQSPLSSSLRFIKLTDQENMVGLDGSVTPLTGVANGVPFRLEELINIPITSGAFTSNHTAQISNLPTSDRHNNIRYGESDYYNELIAFSRAGSEITSRQGQFSLFKLNAGRSVEQQEYIYAKISSATLQQVSRRFCFTRSSTGAVQYPNQAAVNQNNLEIVRTGWLFAGSSDLGSFEQEISYLSPIESAALSSGSFQEGQYWHDLRTNVWKRYTSGNFVDTNRMPIAILAIDDQGGTSTVMGYKCADIYRNYQNINELEWRGPTDGKSYTVIKNGRINVAGRNIQVPLGYTFDLEEHREVGFDAALTGFLYVYLSEKGELFASHRYPVWRSDLGGSYHPGENSRCVLQLYKGTNRINSLTTANNYFPWQRYNTLAQIPVSETKLITASAASQGGGIFIGGGPVGKSGRGTYTITFRPGVFISAPGVQITPAGSVNANFMHAPTASINISRVVFGIHRLDRTDTDNARLSNGSTEDLLAMTAVNLQDHASTLTIYRIGDDLLQTNKDNLYSG